MRRHGSYPRRQPDGARVARWYCRRGHTTFSLLPDCLAARWPGTLAALEAVVLSVEQAPSLEAAADRLRPDIELPGAVRWTRRRVRHVRSVLTTARGLLPAAFADCPPALSAWRARLGVDAVLPALRENLAHFLHALPAPLGLCPRRRAGGDPARAVQQPTGPDPPDGAR